MMDVENVGNTLVFLAKLPLNADVLRMNIVCVLAKRGCFKLTFRAAGMPFIGRG